MYTGLLHLHSLLRWVILILAVLAIYQAFIKSNGLKKTSLWLLIAAHTALLIGLYQWLAGRYGLLTTTRPDLSISLMKDSFYRFFWVEHPVGMITGIVLITIARGKVKKDNYKAASWLYVIALLIILVTIPWPFRAGIGRGWFPGMD